MVTRAQLFKQVQQGLAAAGVESAAHEAFWLFEGILHLTRAQMLADPDRTVSEEEASVLLQAAQKRAEGYPLQYILGEWEFFALPFYVGEGVLIPRADTETVVELALEILAPCKAPRILDLCAGSGCIGIALAKQTPQAQVLAVEYENAAFGYLTRNIARNAANNVTPLLHDALDTSFLQKGREFDLIVSNPPYIDPAVKGTLSKEVGCEPASALFAPHKGLYFYEQMCALYPPFLAKGGTLLFEIGFDQYESVKGLLLGAGLQNPVQKRDLGGHIRALGARRL